MCITPRQPCRQAHHTPVIIEMWSAPMKGFLDPPREIELITATYTDLDNALAMADDNRHLITLIRVWDSGEIIYPTVPRRRKKGRA